MRRRTFLLSAALAVTTLGTGIGIAVSDNDPSEPISEVLARYFPETAIGAEDLALFVEDFASRHERLLARQTNYLLDWLEEGGRAARQAHFESVVVREFLLATDYYEQDAVPPAHVAFIRSADPYVSGCANPLARF